MKKILGMLAIAIALAVVGYTLAGAAATLVPSLLKYGANGTVATTTGDSLNILALSPAGVTATDSGVPGAQPGGLISALPTCNAAALGTRSWVTNAQTTPAFLGTVSTTGAVTAPVFCNGAAWVYD